MSDPSMDTNGFSATRTILSPMPMLGIPEVLLDETQGLWSFRPTGVPSPVIFRCADIESSAIEEIEAIEQPKPMGMEGLTDIIKNPLSISRANATRRKNHVYGINILVTLKNCDDEPLRVRLWTRPIKRGTRSYQNVLNTAREVKAAFDEMMEGGNAQAR